MALASRTRRVVGAVVVTGAVIIGVGAGLTDHPYASSVFAGLGTTVLLAVPLLLFERAFERHLSEERAATDRSLGVLDDRIQELQRSIGDVSERPAELNEQTAQRVAERRASDLEQLVGPARAILEDSFLSHGLRGDGGCRASHRCV